MCFPRYLPSRFCLATTAGNPVHCECAGRSCSPKPRRDQAMVANGNMVEHDGAHADVRVFANVNHAANVGPGMMETWCPMTREGR